MADGVAAADAIAAQLAQPVSVDDGVTPAEVAHPGHGRLAYHITIGLLHGHHDAVDRRHRAVELHLLTQIGGIGKYHTARQPQRHTRRGCPDGPVARIFPRLSRALHKHQRKGRQ